MPSDSPHYLPTTNSNKRIDLTTSLSKNELASDFYDFGRVVRSSNDLKKKGEGRGEEGIAYV